MYYMHNVMHYVYLNSMRYRTYKRIVFFMLACMLTLATHQHAAVWEDYGYTFYIVLFQYALKNICIANS